MNMDEGEIPNPFNSNPFIFIIMYLWEVTGVAGTVTISARNRGEAKKEYRSMTGKAPWTADRT